MKYIHSTPGFNILSLILLVMTGFMGCSDEYSVGPGPTGNAVSFTLTVSDVSIPSVSTRTMEGTNNQDKCYTGFEQKSFYGDFFSGTAPYHWKGAYCNGSKSIAFFNYPRLGYREDKG